MRPIAKDLQRAAPYVPESARLAFLQAIEFEHRPLEQATRRRTQRQAWLKSVADNAEDGRIRVIVWSRDCDCVEGWRSYVCAVSELQFRIDHDLAWADGPMDHGIGKPSIVPEFPRPRDRVLEAFEDGHPHSV